ncbi:hypothetical protein [Bartonella tribocorum]|uniref:hypothetical protein n=1 Tax=Bartonella tribocorum TaxID=85701 RepID=UPI0026CB9AA8
MDHPWLVISEDEVFSDIAKAAGFKAPTLPSGLMKNSVGMAYTTYRDANIKLSS